MYCKQCGTNNDKSAVHCMQCSAWLSEHAHAVFPGSRPPLAGLSAESIGHDRASRSDLRAGAPGRQAGIRRILQDFPAMDDGVLCGCAALRRSAQPAL